MLDVILVAEGETAQVFNLAIGIDREYPMQTALGLATPVPVVPTDKGPPAGASAGWLFHLDAPNLLLTRMWPAASGAHAVHARLLECGLQGGQAEFRCVRKPKRAALVDSQGATVLEPNIRDDACLLDISTGELVNLRVEFE